MSELEPGWNACSHLFDYAPNEIVLYAQWPIHPEGTERPSASQELDLAHLSANTFSGAS